MADAASGHRWTDSPVAFGDALDELKTAGCMLLVVQPPDGDGGHAGCGRMLGSDVSGDRRRLFVQTDAARAAGHGHADHHAGESRTVVFDTTARAATATAPTDTPADQPTTVTDSLAALADAAETELDALAPASGFEPGALRVCVDSFGGLLSAEDLAAAADCVERLQRAVTARNGMGHLHVSRQVPANAVEALLPMFDAVVEVADADEPRQRWHLLDESLSTAWLEL
ncbi:DUF7504 family protein [Halobacterium wangiae]|uniref:DUF7504 family protein n=1 Tax=Halobacterium wangiae TaxID=2902623 RepID=UPI001E319650|nr:hypothetical protein [Halobacterium wangiae]